MVVCIHSFIVTPTATAISPEGRQGSRLLHDTLFALLGFVLHITQVSSMSMGWHPQTPTTARWAVSGNQLPQRVCCVL